MDLKSCLFFTLVICYLSKCKVNGTTGLLKKCPEECNKCVRKQQCSGRGKMITECIKPKAGWTSSAIPKPSSVVDMCTMVFNKLPKYVDGVATITSYPQFGTINVESAPCLLDPEPCTADQGLSVAFWFKNNGVNYDNLLLDTTNDFSNTGIVIENLYDRYYGVTIDAGYKYLNFDVIDTTVNTTEWTLIAFTADESDISVYLDGVKDETSATGHVVNGTSAATANSNMVVMKENNALSSWKNVIPEKIKYQIGHIYYWEQRLTDQQVADLFALGKDGGSIGA